MIITTTITAARLMVTMVAILCCLMNSSISIIIAQWDIFVCFYAIIVIMEYTFSIGWLFGGMAIALAGGLIVVFYKQISDNLANGVSSYEHVKLFGIITVVVGLICTANLHTFLLDCLVSLLFHK